MKFGLIYNTGYYGTDPDQLIVAARHAEACGFESFYLTEHIALYPGATVGSFTIPASMPIADPLECLSFVAAATERILLGTAVLLVPYHHPVILAKRLATLDVLRLLWSGDENGVSFDGEFFSFTRLCSFPKPLAPLPIHVGGSSRAAARRAGLRGDGYFPGGRLTAQERASQFEEMRATAL